MDAAQARTISDVATPKLTESLLATIFGNVSKAAGKGDRSAIISIHEVDVKLHREIVRYMEGKGYTAQIKSSFDSLDISNGSNNWHSLVLKW